MNELNAFWEVVGKGAAIIGVMVAIIQGTRYLYSVTPTAKLEKRVEELEGSKNEDQRHLQRHDEEIKFLQDRTLQTENQIKDINEGIKKIGKSNISMLRHMIDGNGVDKMREEADDLTEFFINR